MRKWPTASINTVNILVDGPAAILNIKTSEDLFSPTGPFLPHHEIQHDALTIEQTWM